jgi:hypothetical protein
MKAKKSIPPPPPDAFGPAAAGERVVSVESDTGIETSGFSLHDLFARQAAKMLDRTDLDEQQKQSILIAMSCPCCGAGGMSFTAKLRRRR